MMLKHHTFTRIVLGTFIGTMLLLDLPAATYADPPSWAPAHGWRKKHDPYYMGYTGRKWDNDYGVISGTCNREAVGAVLGATVGNVVGSQVGKGDGKLIATVLGTVAGAMIGAKIGRDMDKVDNACLGHALELVQDNKQVRWTNPDNGAAYLVTPKQGFTRQGMQCREFTTRVTRNGRTETVPGKACQKSEGVWEMMN